MEIVKHDEDQQVEATEVVAGQTTLPEENKDD